MNQNIACKLPSTVTSASPLIFPHLHPCVYYTSYLLHTWRSCLSQRTVVLLKFRAIRGTSALPAAVNTSVSKEWSNSNWMNNRFTWVMRSECLNEAHWNTPVESTVFTCLNLWPIYEVKGPWHTLQCNGQAVSSSFFRTADAYYVVMQEKCYETNISPRDSSQI